MTPARIAASRRNAQKSTGPRTARGKAQSRINGLRHGLCSPLRRRFWRVFSEASPSTPNEAQNILKTMGRGNK